MNCAMPMEVGPFNDATRTSTPLSAAALETDALEALPDVFELADAAFDELDAAFEAHPARSAASMHATRAARAVFFMMSPFRLSDYVAESGFNRHAIERPDAPGKRADLVLRRI